MIICCTYFISLGISAFTFYDICIAKVILVGENHYGFAEVDGCKNNNGT